MIVSFFSDIPADAEALTKQNRLYSMAFKKPINNICAFDKVSKIIAYRFIA
jgi:hypothetical protein